MYHVGLDVLLYVHHDIGIVLLIVVLCQVEHRLCFDEKLGRFPLAILGVLQSVFGVH